MSIRFLSSQKQQAKPKAMKTSMSIVAVVFFVTFLAISAAPLNPQEACIRRNINRSQPPRSSSLETAKTSMFESLLVIVKSTGFCLALLFLHSVTTFNILTLIYLLGASVICPQVS